MTIRIEHLGIKYDGSPLVDLPTDKDKWCIGEDGNPLVFNCLVDAIDHTRYRELQVQLDCMIRPHKFGIWLVEKSNWYTGDSEKPMLFSYEGDAQKQLDDCGLKECFVYPWGDNA